MMMGLMFGSLIGGQLSDRIGRKKTMMISIFIIVPSVMFGGYSPNYACYAILRLITCTALPCIWVSNHSMTMEAFGNHHRKTVIIVKDFLWPVSQIVLVLIVYYNRNWTDLHLWIGVVCCGGFPCFFILPESPRWLANNNRKEEV
jgi:MFS family permease